MLQYWPSSVFIAVFLILPAAVMDHDRVKEKIIEASGIAILRWKAAPLPSEEKMRADIAALNDQSLRVTADDRLSRG